MRFQIATSQRACRGESICGDEFSIIDGERTLIAVADGLRHGPHAAEAAAAFCNQVERRADDPLAAIMQSASDGISSTRGVAAALLRLDPARRSCSFAGIDNIELQAASQEPIRPVSFPGIVGRRIRKIKEFDYTLNDSDILLLYTDGISSRFSLEDYRNLEPQDLADEILSNHGKFHDDATCIVLKCTT